MRSLRTVVVTAAVAALLVGCGGDGGQKATEADGTRSSSKPSTTTIEESPVDSTTTQTSAPTPAPSEPTPPVAPGERLAGVPGVAVSTVATDLVAPWDVAFVSDGRAFVSERDTGRVLVVHPDGRVEAVHQFAVDAAGEGGLLGLEASPNFAADGQLYAYYTTPTDNRVVRFGPGRSASPVLTGIPAGTVHNGGRLEFGPDGLLYVATGDSGSDELAQDRGSLAGKILRVTPSGGVPAGNPFGTAVWSLGHRNVQGLAWDGSGTLYATEFGPDRNDEVNRIQPGANYGWPLVTGAAGRAGYVDPVAVLQPAEASPSGAVIVGSGGGAWSGDLVFAGLRGERLWRADLSGGGVASLQPTAAGVWGRLRAVVQAPDGSLWVLTNNRDGRGDPRAGDDRILRLVPD